MSPKQRYVAAECTHCGHKQAVDLQKLCRERTIVLGVEGEKSRLVVTCKQCGERFTITADCTEFRR